MALSAVELLQTQPIARAGPRVRAAAARCLAPGSRMAVSRLPGRRNRERRLELCARRYELPIPSLRPLLSFPQYRSNPRFSSQSVMRRSYSNCSHRRCGHSGPSRPRQRRRAASPSPSSVRSPRAASWGFRAGSWRCRRRPRTPAPAPACPRSREAGGEQGGVGEIGVEIGAADPALDPDRLVSAPQTRKPAVRLSNDQIARVGAKVPAMKRL